MYFFCPGCKIVGHYVIDRSKYPTDAEWLATVAPDTPYNEMPKVLCYLCYKGRVAEIRQRLESVKSGSSTTLSLIDFEKSLKMVTETMPKDDVNYGDNESAEDILGVDFEDEP